MLYGINKPSEIANSYAGVNAAGAYTYCPFLMDLGDIMGLPEDLMVLRFRFDLVGTSNYEA